MFTRLFGKPKQEANALTTLDKLNEVWLNFLSIQYASEVFFFFFCTGNRESIDCLEMGGEIYYSNDLKHVY